MLLGRGFCEGRSLVQRSRTECGVPECVLETSTMRRTTATRAAEPWERRGGGVGGSPFFGMYPQLMYNVAQDQSHTLAIGHENRRKRISLSVRYVLLTTY